MDAGQETSSREKAWTAAVMGSTAEQLRLAAEILDTLAAASPNAQTAARLRPLGAAVSAQAADIQERADRLTDDLSSVPGRLANQEQREQGDVSVDGERPLP